MSVVNLIYNKETYQYCCFSYKGKTQYGWINKRRTKLIPVISVSQYGKINIDKIIENITVLDLNKNSIEDAGIPKEGE